MTIERAKQLAKQWANGYVCSLREEEEEEYHKLCFSALRAQQQLERNSKELESNEPLTADELRDMDGEPVYIHSDTFPGDCGWRVVKKASVLDIQFTDGDCFLFTFYGKSWIAYRRKPEEV